MSKFIFSYDPSCLSASLLYTTSRYIYIDGQTARVIWKHSPDIFFFAVKVFFKLLTSFFLVSKSFSKAWHQFFCCQSFFQNPDIIFFYVKVFFKLLTSTFLQSKFFSKSWHKFFCCQIFFQILDINYFCVNFFFKSWLQFFLCWSFDVNIFIVGQQLIYIYRSTLTFHIEK